MIEAAGSDPNQSHIEDYFQTANEIDVLIHENDKLSNLLRQYEFNSTANYTQIEFNSFPNMLQHIICNAMKNAEKLPKGQRHLEIVKKFATSLFIYTGPFAYHFLQQNVSLALPSLRSIQNYISSQYSVISEGAFRFDELFSILRDIIYLGLSLLVKMLLV